MTPIESMDHLGEMQGVGLVPFLDKHNGFNFPVVQPAEADRGTVVCVAFLIALAVGIV
jgi:hypothetical protein